MCPSRHEIPVEDQSRHELNYHGFPLEIWVRRNRCDSSDDAEALVLKFAGAGGRGERATLHPVDFWSDLKAEVWAVNPPGYGGSNGRASMRHLPAVGRAVYEGIRARAAGRPVIVTGNSLGTTTALHVAAHFRDMAALVLRNPPALRQLIVGKHGWWNGYVGAWLISRQVPQQLDSIANAAQSPVPAVFLVSGKDRVVPPEFQQPIIDAYAGAKRVMRLADADHVAMLTESEQTQYGRHLSWLREQIFASATCGSERTEVE